MRCGACRQVYYCSSGHQSNDWAAHKPLCNRPPLEVLAEIKQGENGLEIIHKILNLQKVSNAHDATIYLS